ncbi:hypothetical protein AB0A91_32945 [Streptomyces sp. NPDC042207]|uniref:hypothetical protein n=1 Tax=Streptomyces sp. NPDC042207 TaxID=3154331 RepID=UPI0033F6E085
MTWPSLMHTPHDSALDHTHLLVSDLARTHRGTPQTARRYVHFVRSRDPITLTVPETRHLLVATFNPPAVTAARLLHWST